MPESHQIAYQRRARAEGLCIICRQPAKLRRDGAPGIYCAEHAAANTRRDKTGARRVARYLAKLKRQRAVRRSLLGGRHCCAVCGLPGHNKRTCVRKAEVAA